MSGDNLVKFTREQAERLAELVRAYWRERGCEIDVWIEPISRTYSHDFAVRSNLRFRARPAAELKPPS